MTLVMSMSGLAHKAGCRAMGKSIYKVIAPDMPTTDVPEFLRARRVDPCKVCLGEFAAVAE